MAFRSRGVLPGIAGGWATIFFLGAGLRLLANCSSFGLPFGDLGSTTFCAQIAEAYYTGLSNGTSATTYSPAANVPREQMAAFVTRTLDQSLLRGSRRAALSQWWNSTPHFDRSVGLTAVEANPRLLQSDGADVWVADNTGFVTRVQASNGKRELNAWTGATSAFGVLVAMGLVFVTGSTSPGSLYLVDPTLAAQPVQLVSHLLGDSPHGIAFDGNRIWTANLGGSVSIVSPGDSWDAVTVTAGFSLPLGAVFDGTNIWVTDIGDSKIKRLDISDGSIVQSVNVGSNPSYPAFDGHNIWVPNFLDNSLTVLRAADGVVLKTFSAGNGDQNGLNGPTTAAFDGQRVLVANQNGGLSLFKATDLSPIGTFATTGVTTPFGACSDGVNFWVSFGGSSKIGRF